jgi:predicted  nucleic acid-binding Zn-ribbon protein
LKKNYSKKNKEKNLNLKLIKIQLLSQNQIEAKTLKDQVTFFNDKAEELEKQLTDELTEKEKLKKQVSDLNQQIEQSEMSAKI